MFKGRFTTDGKGLIFSDFYKAKLKWYMKQNPNQPFEIVPTLVESKKLRGWFEVALCPLVAFYQEGMDHRDANDIKKVREWLKMEFNSELVPLFGKVHRIAKSTKNTLNAGFIERVVDYLIENFAPPIEVLDSKKYLHWHDAVFPFGGPDNYIDYLVETKVLEKIKKKALLDKSNDFEFERDAPNYSLAEEQNEYRT